MKFNYRYHGVSGASHSANASHMSFTPDTLREPTFFVAELAQHISFREAMSALHHVVVSDLRLQPKNRDDYFAWLKSEETNMLAELANESQKIVTEVKELRQRLTNIRTTKNKVMQPFYKAQNDYFQYLYKSDYNAWFVLDPVITVHPDSVFFECFSQDESSYGKLSCNLDVFKNVSEFACGTTNIDYSADLYNEFQKIRDYKTTAFQIDPSGFEVQTTHEENFVEQKIDLPDSWVRGFLQVSSAMTLPSAHFNLHPMDMHNFLFILKQKKERHGPRAIRFELVPDRPIKVIFEPWNREVICKRSIYKGSQPQEIRIWGRRRLLLLERLIPIAKVFHIHLLGTGLPSFFEADMGDMTFTLGLSGWTANDWSKVSNFDLMAPRGDVDGVSCEQVLACLKQQWYASADLIANHTNLDRITVLSALSILTQSGRVIFDIKNQVYRLRELSREPLPMSDLRFSNEREHKADNFIKAKLVELTDIISDSYKLKLIGNVMDNGSELQTTMTLDADQRLVDGSCQCHFYKQNQLRKGPCEHMLSLRRYHSLNSHKNLSIGELS